jgi:hypothetical protein
MRRGPFELGHPEIEHKPIAAFELNPDASPSQLRDRLLRLSETAREDPATPLVLGHGSRLLATDPEIAEGATQVAPSRVSSRVLG